LGLESYVEAEPLSSQNENLPVRIPRSAPMPIVGIRTILLVIRAAILASGIKLQHDWPTPQASSAAFGFASSGLPSSR